MGSIEMAENLFPLNQPICYISKSSLCTTERVDTKDLEKDFVNFVDEILAQDPK